jgi:hypothetical protein
MQFRRHVCIADGSGRGPGVLGPPGWLSMRRSHSGNHLRDASCLLMFVVNPLLSHTPPKLSVPPLWGRCFSLTAARVGRCAFVRSLCSFLHWALPLPIPAARIRGLMLLPSIARWPKRRARIRPCFLSMTTRPKNDMRRRHTPWFGAPTGRKSMTIHAPSHGPAAMV